MVSSSVMMDNYGGPITNIRVKDNRLEGGVYTLYSDAQFTAGPIQGVSILNNRFVMGTGGYALIRKNTPTVTGNVDDVTNASIDDKF